MSKLQSSWKVEVYTVVFYRRQKGFTEEPPVSVGPPLDDQTLFQHFFVKSWTINHYRNLLSTDWELLKSSILPVKIHYLNNLSFVSLFTSYWVSQDRNNWLTYQYRGWLYILFFPTRSFTHKRKL